MSSLSVNLNDRVTIYFADKSKTNRMPLILADMEQPIQEDILVGHVMEEGYLDLVADFVAAEIPDAAIFLQHGRCSTAAAIAAAIANFRTPAGSAR